MFTPAGANGYVLAQRSTIKIYWFRPAASIESFTQTGAICDRMRWRNPGSVSIRDELLLNGHHRYGVIGNCVPVRPVRGIPIAAPALTIAFVEDSRESRGGYRDASYRANRYAITYHAISVMPVKQQFIPN